MFSLAPIPYIYLLKKLLFRIAVLTAIFVGVYSTIDYVETVSNSGTSKLYLVYGYKLPEMISHLLPLVLAMAILLTVADCRRKGEWVALQMTGLSVRRLMGMLMVIPVLLLPLAYLNAHQWAPLAMMQFEKAVNHEGMKPLTQYRENNRIVSGGEDGTVTIVDRDQAGRAVQLRILELETDRTIHVWQHENSNYRMSSTDGNFSAGGILKRRNVPQYGINGIFAASVTSKMLLEMVRDLEIGGAGTGAFETTVALRHSIVLAVVMVPLVALLLFLSVEKLTAMFSAVAMAMASAAGYWGILMLSWAWTTSVQVGIHWIPVLCVIGMAGGGGALALRLKTLRR